MLSENRYWQVLVAILLLFTFALPAFCALTSLRGHLRIPEVEFQPWQLLVSGSDPVELMVDKSVEMVFRDPLLAGRLWELRGHVHEDDHFVIERMFTVKDGQLYRVTYYCEICHITTHEPGRCMCCQEETELREIPDDD